MQEKKKAKKAARRARISSQAIVELETAAADEHTQMEQWHHAAEVTAVPDTPVAFVFPGQGSQAVGMLKVRAPALPTLLHYLHAGA